MRHCNRMALLCGLLAISLPAAGSLLPDGSFEHGIPGAPPDGWVSESANSAAGEFTVVAAGNGRTGAQALRITHRTPAKPNVYRRLATTVKLQPNREYELRYFARGRNVNQITWSFGKRWQERFRPAAPGEQWVEQRFVFIARPDEFEADGGYLIQFLAEDIIDELFLDDLELRELSGGEGYPVPAVPADWRGQLTAPAGVPRVSLDSREGNYTGDGGRPGVSGSLAFGFDGDGLVLWAEVNDSTPHTEPNGDLWRGDSIQIRFDFAGDRHAGERPEDLEVGFAPSEEGITSWSWQLDRALSPEECELTGGAFPGGYRLRARLSPKLIGALTQKPDRRFSFNWIINNFDGERREVLWMAPGINTSAKSSADHRLAWYDDGNAALLLAPDAPEFTDEAAGRVFFSNLPGGTVLEFMVSDRDGNRGAFLSGPVSELSPHTAGSLPFRWDLSKFSDGNLSVETTLPGNRKWRDTLQKRNVRAEQLAALEAIARRQDELRAQVAALPGAERRSRYLQLADTLLTRHLRLLRTDLQRRESPEATSFYLKRGEIELAGLRELLRRYEELLGDDDARRKQDSWTFLRLEEPPVCRNGMFDAIMGDTEGNERRRPVYFAGYGHFSDAARDLPEFSQYGANVVQLEIGPASFFRRPRPGEGEFEHVVMDHFRNYIEKAMREAQENHQTLCLLLSPHYQVDWYVDAHPEMKAPTGGYILNHERSREMLRRYLAVVIPAIRDSRWAGAVADLVLSNEPNLVNLKPETSYVREAFDTWLSRQPDSLADWNRKSGRGYPDSAALLAAAGEDPAAFDLFQRFKRSYLSDWHAFMADEVRKHHPAALLSVKAMAFHSFLPQILHDGVDVEALGKISDLNGNDNYSYYDSRRWGTGWVRMAMTNDLQYSLRPLMIANTENHIIPDGSQVAVPYEHVYAATLEQFLFGVGTLVTWVWTDLDFATYRATPVDLHGGVFRRPSALLAQGEALLDANRLSEEFLAFRRTPSRVGIVYSPSSLFRDAGRYSVAAEQLYTLLNFCGAPVCFLSEEQLARGEFGAVRLLFLPGVTALSDTAAAGLRRFSADGGTVASWRTGGVVDQFGREQELPPMDRPADEFETESDFLAALLKLIPADSAPFARQIRVRHPLGTLGLLLREGGTADGVRYLNCVNYNQEPRTLELPVPARELLSGRRLEGAVEMKPLEVWFLELPAGAGSR